MNRAVRMKPEDELALRLKHAGIRFKREVPIIPGRKYRFDFQCFNKSQAVLVEVQGGIYMRRSGHNTAAGITRDAEKISLAAVHGYRTIVATTDHVRDGQALKWIQQALGLVPPGPLRYGQERPFAVRGADSQRQPGPGAADRRHQDQRESVRFPARRPVLGALGRPWRDLGQAPYRMGRKADKIYYKIYSGVNQHGT